MLFLKDVPKYISERQLTSKYFCDNFLKQSKVQLLTRPRLGVSHPCWVQVQKKAFKTHWSFLQLQSLSNKVVFPMLPMLQMFRSHNASDESLLPLNSLKRIDGSILSQNYSKISRIYLFGNTNFNSSVKTITLNAIIIKY